MTSARPLLHLRFRRRRPLRARRDPRAAAGRAARLRRRQRRLSLRHQEPRPRSRRGSRRCSAGSPSAIDPRADRHRLQHRLDHRARRGARRARPADRRHGAGDQAGRGAVEDPARSACSAPRRRSASPMSTGSRPSSPPTASVDPPRLGRAGRAAEAKLRGEPADPAAFARVLGRPARAAGRRADRHDRPRLHPFPAGRGRARRGRAAAASRFVDGKEGIARRTAWLTRDLSLARRDRRKASRCSPASRPTSTPIGAGLRRLRPDPARAALVRIRRRLRALNSAHIA